MPSLTLSRSKARRTRHLDRQPNSQGAVSLLLGKVESGPAVPSRPERATFEAFLREDARVPIGGGHYGPYSFEGREVILDIVRLIDRILDEKLTDSYLAIAGGAQWGKTILELNFLAYATAQRFFNVGLYLPDADLVQGIVDTKLRPDVIDQVGWFAQMISLGKAVNQSGKAVDRKGAFNVTDGQRRANGMVLGLGKVPTSFTFDIALKDERDDLPEKNAKFVEGRLTNSALRFELEIGTQRMHGRGQHAAWKSGSQGVVELGGINPEEAFPGIIRCAVAGTPLSSDPKLTWAGDFRHDHAPNTVVTTHRPENIYYLAHPETGAQLDRSNPAVVHRRPEQIARRRWSIRVSQLGIGALSLSKIVKQFEQAVSDPGRMEVFRCDVLGLPKSTAQALAPSVLTRAQQLDAFEVRAHLQPGRPGFGGLDMGDTCWFVARERESEGRKRLVHAVPIPLGDVVERTIALFHQFGLSGLCVDLRPEAQAARDIALALNGLHALDRWPELVNGRLEKFSCGPLSWDGTRWRGARCFVVTFTRHKIGSGITHALEIFPQGGQIKFVPKIECNREDTIDRVVREFLTPAEGVNDYHGRPPVLREEPAMLLPIRGPGPGASVVETLENHLLTGSERERRDDGAKGDYVDQCANHFLLADAYSALAEGEDAAGHSAGGFSYRTLPLRRTETKQARFGRRTLA